MATPVDSWQKHFRFRNDDGSETTATWKAALDTNINQVPNTNFRLRYAIEIQPFDLGGWTNLDNLKMQCSMTRSGISSSYADITSSSTYIRLSSSASVADEASTTQQISSPDSFTANNVLTSTTLSTATVGTATNTLEIEICAQVRSADTANGDYIDFKVVNGSDTGTNTATAIARLTVTGSRRAVVIS